MSIGHCSHLFIPSFFTLSSILFVIHLLVIHLLVIYIIIILIIYIICHYYLSFILIKCLPYYKCFVQQIAEIITDYPYFYFLQKVEHSALSKILNWIIFSSNTKSTGLFHGIRTNSLLWS